MKVLITGGAGFIGSHLVDALYKTCNIHVVDNFSTGKIENIKQDVTIKMLDITTNEFIRYVVENGPFDVCYHLASIPRVQQSIDIPKDTTERNIIGTINVAEMARMGLIGRIIYASSSSVYGSDKDILLDEEMPVNPKSPYALQKYFGELLLKQYYMHYGVKSLSLRFFNVYGPRQSAESGYACLIPNSINKIENNKPVVIYGDGSNSRDFTYVYDVAMALKNSGIIASDDICDASVLNIGTGYNTSVLDVVKLIQKYKYKDTGIEFEQPRVEPKSTRADITKAFNLINYQPQVDIENGISRVCE